MSGFLQSSTTRLIYAYHDSDPTDSSAPSEYHGPFRGVMSLYLLEAKVKTISLPDDARHFDMTVNNVSNTHLHSLNLCVLL